MVTVCGEVNVTCPECGHEFDEEVELEYDPEPNVFGYYDR